MPKEPRGRDGRGKYEVQKLMKMDWNPPRRGAWVSPITVGEVRATYH